MAYSSITKPSLHFNTKLYTGNGSTNAISSVGHQPDLVWLKERSSAGAGLLFDAVRTATKFVRSSDSAAEVTAADTLTAFNSDGFTLGADASNYAANQNSETYASWNWKAGGGQGSSNTDGSINTTYTSVNTTAGFSIVKYTGNQTSGASVGHGLGVAPKMILVKSLSEAHAWRVYHKSVGATKELYLNLTNVPYTATNVWNDQEPTSSVFYLGNNDSGTNKSGVTYVAYCFAEKTGYSKIGSYTGNGSTDGTFTYLGFKPAMIIIKRTDTAKNWYLHDSKRDGYNNDNPYLSPNLSAAETGGTEIDILSNGFKLRASGTGHNESGGTYIYMAFAEEPLVANVGASIPATAR